MCATRVVRQVLTGNYSPLRLLHINDYVLEKAFVYGIIALSKWLGEDLFAKGVFGQWPPPGLYGLVTEWISADVVDIDAVASSSSDAHLFPHLTIGSAAAPKASGAPP